MARMSAAKVTAKKGKEDGFEGSMSLEYTGNAFGQRLAKYIIV
jgi:hypothetical protein